MTHHLCQLMLLLSWSGAGRVPPSTGSFYCAIFELILVNPQHGSRRRTQRLQGAPHTEHMAHMKQLVAQYQVVWCWHCQPGSNYMKRLAPIELWEDKLWIMSRCVVDEHPGDLLFVVQNGDQPRLMQSRSHCWFGWTKTCDYPQGSTWWWRR